MLTAHSNSDPKEVSGARVGYFTASTLISRLCPSGFHLFRSMVNSLNNLSFGNDEEVKCHLKNFFSNKPASFYENEIMKLTEWWNKVIENEGNYVID